MAYHLLTIPPPLDPFWLERLRRSPVTGTVGPDGDVEAGGRRLLGAPYPAGTEVTVSLNGRGQVMCESRVEADHRRAELLAQEETLQRQREQQQRLARAEARQRAEATNALVQLPVRWAVGIKDVLSGLSATSSGSGRNKATVQHVLLLEDLQAGRVERKAGQFLCDSPSAPQAKQWAAKRMEPCQDEHGSPYVPEVTCKRCLALVPKPRIRLGKCS